MNVSLTPLTRFVVGRSFFLVMFSAVLQISSGQFLSAAEYYVAPTGNDADSGSQPLPWKTITKAADSMVAGDTVYIAPGTYRERIIPMNSGTSVNYITYRAQAGGNVVVDGQTLTLPPYESGLVHIEDINFIKVSGLHIKNAGPNFNNAGIYIDNANSIILEKNNIYNTVSSGIGVWNSTNITIEGNEIELACNDGEQECITVANTNKFVINNNEVHHNGPGTNGGEGIDVKEGSSNGKVEDNYIHDLTRLGIYIEAWDKHTYSIEVNRNRIHNCQNDGITLASEQGGLLENIRVENNVIYNNDINGISITPNGRISNPPMKKLSIVNNTLHNNGRFWGGGIAVDNPNIQDLTIRNNVFSENKRFQILIDRAVDGLAVDHNLINGYRNYSNEIKGSSFVEGDPMFVSSGSGDFHLTSSSPAINAGSPVNAPSVDFDSMIRPQRGIFDIGAYEYVDSRGISGIFFLLLGN